MKFNKPIDLINESSKLYDTGIIDDSTYQKFQEIIDRYGSVYVKYKSAMINGDVDSKRKHLIEMKQILLEYNNIKQQNIQTIVPKSIKETLQDNLASGNINEDDYSYLNDIYINHTVYFNK